MQVFLQYTSGNLAFKNLFYGPSKNTIGVVRGLTSRTILKMRCKSSLKYLAIENKVEDAIKGSKLGTEFRSKRFLNKRSF